MFASSPGMCLAPRNCGVSCRGCQSASLIAISVSHFRLVRFRIRRGEERFVARPEGVAVGFVPPIPFDATILRPFDQNSVAFPALRHISINQRRVAACGEAAAGNTAITLHRVGDGNAQLDIHLSLHIDYVIADEGRAGRGDAALHQPGEDLVKRLGDNGGQFREGRLRANADVGLFTYDFLSWVRLL